MRPTEGRAATRNTSPATSREPGRAKPSATPSRVTGTGIAGAGSFNSPDVTTIACSADGFGLDLEKNPDQTLDPVIAARVLASYFKHRPGLVEACEQENWREVRRLVNGQYNGWERFHALVLPLAAAAKVVAAADATAVRPAK